MIELLYVIGYSFPTELTELYVVPIKLFFKLIVLSELIVKFLLSTVAVYFDIVVPGDVYLLPPPPATIILEDFELSSFPLSTLTDVSSPPSPVAPFFPT